MEKILIGISQIYIYFLYNDSSIYDLNLNLKYENAL